MFSTLLLILCSCFQSLQQAMVGSDITVALQQEIDKAIAEKRTKVTLPDKAFKVSDTIHLGRGDTFVTISLESEGMGLPYITRGGATLEATFTDKPIINVQGGRGVHIRGIQFVGPSSAIQTQLPTPSQDEARYDTYFTPAKNRQFCGVSIDAYSGQAPIEMPIYPGVYSKRHTSMVKIEDCQFRFLGCGMITKPSGGQGADNNGDYLIVENCNFQFCKYGASINGSQTRQNTFRDCKFADCYAGVGMGQHGVGLCGNVILTGGAFDRIGFGLIGKKVGYASGITIENMCGEQICTVLDVVDGHGVCQVTIDKVRFATDNDTLYNFKPYHIRSEQCVTRISNSIFRTWGTSNRPMFTIVGSTWMMLDGNTVRRVNTDPKNSPLTLVFPTHPSTEIAEGPNYAFKYKSERLERQTRIIGAGRQTSPRTFRGVKTLECKVDEVYAIGFLSEVNPLVFKVIEVTPTELVVEILNCGVEVKDSAATLSKLQRWENFVWRLP